MRRLKILFIDDEEVIRESFLRLTDWESSRFDVVGIYKNGEAAWDFLQKNPVDIVVSDINMPFMDGIHLLENMRQKKLQVRIIFLTGYEFFEYAQKAVQLQAFDFLLKPVTRPKLMNAIERAAADIDRTEAVSHAASKGLERARNDLLNRVLYGTASDLKVEAEQAGVYCGAGSYLLLMAVADVDSQNQLADGERDVR